MNLRNVVKMLAELAALKYFPAGNEAVLLALARLCGDMCENEAQVRWIVDQMTSGIYQEWPGPQELRAVLCNRWRPKDGINAYSTVYPDGLPLSKERRLEIAAAALKALPPGHNVSVDMRLEQTVNILVSTNKIARSMGPNHATPAEIAAAPQWLRKLEGYE